ncbi:MAG: hypothetical protein A2Y25_00040 [Candidatus Melainabacteria bacterium GWF2_37_15]|nr:MAG: hypothetical protein A2Y25_00040 [Candidatus Melainabacteria bacterium GWF2_37_15]
MKDRVFVDTNIYIYFLLEDKENPDKTQKAQNIIKKLYDKEIIISVQVLNEIYNTLLKYKISDDLIRKKLDLIISKTVLTDTNLYTLEKCWEIKSKYNYSYWDSLIIASAIQADCFRLYTEDMQHRQIIDMKVGIENPFLED